MSLAIFDLDNTLLADDSDYLWGQFLVDQGIVDSSYYEQENDRFYKEYKEGNLDIYEFLKFSLKPLADNPLQDLLKWRSQFIEEVIRPILLKPAQELINKHQQQGDILLVITATNKFVTEPIVELYGINHLLATTPEFLGERYTGNVAGTPCFQEGKITRLNEWLQVTGYSLDDSWFYSDSHNDLPLLQLVEHPVAVNPDEKLKQYAEKSNWPIISLRDK
ncbi:HAD family hydrolase [methanotrophic endosymbiont of Bathymodiolus puteoserpentis (Logatchev)]|jgi:HAD superfamily hydrolase (TIGR01490 family)|uniref:histidinol-phosphatase n=1 Tax=methanotrophic endosymbiont of Bathymodiolus puteoserpentis (Logatchev) TaxID=343235 RepID=UPI0013C99062|nr:HAD family hydrolase [methanotrophic endosymbiont of Bathymodiolus puteoserpentis (Logatchev)]SHE19545.1 Phosphoserine phosphatase [methanotrophic endosymbiont of Bathymodiolus puteoserpentis (Logatchev)]